MPGFSPVGGAPVGFDGKVSGAHRYWRLLNTAAQSGTGYITLDRIQFFGPNGTTNLSVGGTATDNAHYGNSPASMAFVGNPAVTSSTTPGYNAASNGSVPYWVEYDFGTPVRIGWFLITCGGDSRGPGSFQLQYSDDNSNWFTTYSYTAATWSAASTQYFAADSPVPANSLIPTPITLPVGAHKYWRLYSTACPSGNYITINDITFYDQTGTAISTSGGSAGDSGHYGSASAAAGNVFTGGSPTTSPYNYASSGALPSYLGYEFASAVTVASFSVTASADNRCLGTFSLDFSDDGSTWTTAYQYVASTPWTAFSTQTFQADPAYDNLAVYGTLADFLAGLDIGFLEGIAMFALADRVIETTATTGTGTITLGGAVSQAQSFAAGIGVGNTTDYCIRSGDGTGWETGTGTIGGTGPYTLTRSPAESSNGGSLVSLSGTSTVFCTALAKRFSPPEPTLVQAATVTNNSSGNLSVTFGANPTPGNLLIFICSGWKGQWNPPAGVVPVGGVVATGTSAQDLSTTDATVYYGDSSTDLKKIQVYARPVQSGDGETWTFNIGSTTYGFNCVALEYSGVGTIDVKTMVQIAPSSSSATVYCPLLMAERENEIVWTVFVSDNGSVGVTNPANYTVQYSLQSPTFAYNEGVYALRNSPPNPGAPEVPSFACTGLSTSLILASATIRLIPAVVL